MPRRLKKAPELYTLPSHTSFVDGLVRGIRARFGDDPLTLSDVLILLPNRRAVRSLREAFLREADGKSLLLPRIEPIGDVDEDDLFLSGGLPQATWNMDLAPPIPPFMRQILLMDIIERWYDKRREVTPEKAQCALLAQALGQFLDHVQTENLTFKELENLVPSEYASHWQQTLDFLKILTEHWPDILATTGFSDVAARRNILLDGLGEKWISAPPPHPIIAAGSTGSLPATAKLLSVISRLPQGMVLLPGLDLSMDEESWARLNDTHPQATMKHLLAHIGAGRDLVEDWLAAAPKINTHLARHHLLQEMMRPAETTDQWPSLQIDLEMASRGFARLEAPGLREEAGMIALMLRKVLETEGKTAALVTPDRQLARRVAGEMKRWDILVDDSAGTPLFNSTRGVYLRLTAQLVGEGLAPVALLSVLKHPLSAGGQGVGEFRKMTRLLEEKILRGPRPPAGCAGISLAISQAISQAISLAILLGIDGAKKTAKNQKDVMLLKDWWQDIAQMIMPFEAVMAAPDASFEDLLISHIEMVEKLSASHDRGGAERFWAGDSGEAAAQLMADLQDAAPHMRTLTSESYPALLEVFMGSITVRPKYGQHPRLNIWGPLEARLQQADLVILSGLNEASWPPEPAPDPWMSRPMRAAFGLPSLERKIGLSAHDFLQAASARQVVLTRSEKVEGTPTVKSRWLSRMDAIAPNLAKMNNMDDWLAWYRALDLPTEKLPPLKPPRPTPPISSRPRKLSVTRIQTWMQDPYSIYASHILALTALDPLDMDPGAADKGIIIHEALDVFMRAYPDHLPDDATAKLIAIGREKFENYLDRPTVRAFWWPRFVQVAEWFVENERALRPTSITAATEISGAKIFALAGGDFTLTAKADRIDRLEDGSYSIIDYKTGQSPTARSLYAGFAPQLPLEGLMAQGGNFNNLAAGPVSDLSYWKLSGGEAAAKITAFNLSSRAKMDVSEVIKASYDGLVKLVTTFDLPETPYLNNPRPDHLGYGDYDHLARTKEWQGNDLSDPDGSGEESK